MRFDLIALPGRRWRRRDGQALQRADVNRRRSAGRIPRSCVLHGDARLLARERHRRSNGVSGVKVASGIDQTMTLSEGRLVSAGGVSIVGGKAVNVGGSTPPALTPYTPTPYTCRAAARIASVITSTAGDGSRSVRVMIPKSSIRQSISSGSTLTIPCRA